jgi:hypothetical protein
VSGSSTSLADANRHLVLERTAYKSCTFMSITIGLGYGVLRAALLTWLGDLRR